MPVVNPGLSFRSHICVLGSAWPMTFGTQPQQLCKGSLGGSEDRAVVFRAHVHGLWQAIPLCSLPQFPHLQPQFHQPQVFAIIRKQGTNDPE